MNCINCDSEDFVMRSVRVEQDFQGRAITVVSPVTVCNRCGMVTLTLEQADDLHKRTLAEWKKAFKL